MVLVDLHAHLQHGQISDPRTLAAPQELAECPLRVEHRVQEAAAHWGAQRRAIDELVVCPQMRPDARRLLDGLCEEHLIG